MIPINQPIRVVLIVALILTSPGLSIGAGASPAALPCRDRRDVSGLVAIPVDGETATGRYAAPAHRPSTLVVINHGYSFDSHAWQWIMRDMAREHGVLVVAMDYRGTVAPGDFDGDGRGDYHERKGARWDGSPRARGWPIAAGATDTNAITELVKRRCSSIEETVLFSVSMGVGAGGMALAESRGLYDYWIAVEGVTNLFEEYHGACALARTGNKFATAACEDMAAETGNGNPSELSSRTLITRSDEIGDSGLKGAVVVHAFEDGQAPYDQGRQLQVALRMQAIPTEFFSIGRRDAESEQGTALSTHAGNSDTGLAGHATEVSDTHINMRVAYARLWKLIEERDVPDADREFVVDRNDVYPPP